MQTNNRSHTTFFLFRTNIWREGFSTKACVTRNLGKRFSCIRICSGVFIELYVRMREPDKILLHNWLYAQLPRKS